MKVPSASAFLCMSLLVAPKLLPQASTPDFDFTVSVPNDGKVLQGNAASYVVTATNGSSSDVTIGVSGLPSGATLICSANPCAVRPGPNPLTLSIATAKVRPGSYTLTLTGNKARHTAPLEVCGFQLSATPSSGVVMPGGRAVFGVTVKRVNFTGDIQVRGSVLPPAEVGATFDPDPLTFTDSQTSSTLFIGVPVSTPPQSFKAHLTATTTSGPASDYKDVDITVGPVGDATRILLGLEQSGAAAASSTMKFFMDFFISRPLFQAHSSSLLGSPHHWWGDVRVGAVPLQTSTSVSSIGAGLTQLARGLKLNELAQAAEFQTGYEYQRPSWRGGPFTPLVHDHEYTGLGLIASVGASLPFDPRSSIQYFDLPALTFTDSNGAQQIN